MTVYAAGYLRTQTAAAKLQAAERNRVVIPVAAPDSIGVAPRAVELPQAVATAPAVNPAAPASPRRARSEAKKARAAIATPSDQLSVPPAQSAPPATPEPASPATPATTAVVEPQATPVPAPAAPIYKDGSYTGWGTSRHGDIQATVVIEGGRIASAVISQCLTRYSCAWVAHLQGQVVTRQSPEVDYVSGATQSTNAFYYAVVEALGKAK
jgi:uncharacterized protein with FMN-binding domain